MSIEGLNRPPEKKEKQKIVLVNVEDLAGQAAHDAAERELTASKEQMRGLKGFFSRIWKHGLAHEYFRQKEVAKASEAIRVNEDIYAAEHDPGIEKTAHAEAMSAIVERFSHEYEETLHKGESRVSFSKEAAEPNPLGDELRVELSSMVRDYASGVIKEDEDFAERRRRILNRLSARTGGSSDALYADNLLEIAKQARLAVEHGKGLDALDEEFEIVIGKARGSVGTEANYNMVDKVIESVRKSPVGTLVNESTLATGVAIASAVTIGLGKRLLSSRAAAWATFGGTAALAGLFTGIAENKRFKEDRRQHSREMAQGRAFGADAPRREEMEKLAYEMRNANELTTDLRGALYARNASGARELKALTPEQLEQAIGKLAEIEARIRLNDRERIDLVSYSDPTRVEQERRDLDIARAEAKADMRTLASVAYLPAGRSVDDLLAFAVDARMRELVEGDNGLEARDALFNKMKTKRVAKAAAFGVLGGLAVGAAVQEATAFVNDSQTGFLERIFMGKSAGSSHATPIEYLRSVMTGTASSAGPFHEVAVGGGRVQLPQSMNLLPDGSGGYALMQGDKSLAQGIRFTGAGVLDKDSAEMLRGRGIFTSSTVENITQTATGPVAAKDYVAQHSDLMTRVQRTLWYDNNTPKPVFDKNELKLWWGGQHNSGIDAHGRYTFSVKHMMPGGSYHAGLSANAQELAKNDQLKMLFSISADTQAHPIAVAIDPDGTVHIDPKSEAGRLLFEQADGKARFLGRFAEVAHTVSSKNGADQVHILATYEGKGLPQVPAPTHPIAPIPRNIFEPAPILDLPPVLPIFGRRPLEPLKKRLTPEPEEVIHDPIYGNGSGEKLKQRFTDLDVYRNSEIHAARLEESLRQDPSWMARHAVFLKRLDALRNFEFLTDKEKGPFIAECDTYNKRYGINPPFSHEEFARHEIWRSTRQLENIVIEESEKGGKPFAREFYDSSPLRKGLEAAEEIVIVLDDPIGDAVLTLPVLESLKRYLHENGMDEKKVKLLTNRKKLLLTLEHQYSNVQVSSLEEGFEDIARSPHMQRFVINTNKLFERYEKLGMKESDSGDPSKIMSVDWASWSKEEYPLPSGKMTIKYDTIPARIARNFEIMAGQKLFEDINAVDHFIERGPNFERESEEIRSKYKVAPDAKIFVISAGSSVTPKEYQPEKWKIVIEGIFKKQPAAHVLFLDDPDTARRERYGGMVDSLASEGLKVTRVQEGMEKMNTIMSMADYVLTPDTGLGHFAGALGKPAVMLFLSDPVRWSTPGTVRVGHKKAYETYMKGKGSYDRAWSTPQDIYYVTDGDILVGASDIDPEKILAKIPAAGKDKKIKANRSPIASSAVSKHTRTPEPSAVRAVESGPARMPEPLAAAAEPSPGDDEDFDIDDLDIEDIDADPAVSGSSADANAQAGTPQPAPSTAPVQNVIEKKKTAPAKPKASKKKPAKEAGPAPERNEPVDQMVKDYLAYQDIDASDQMKKKLLERAANVPSMKTIQSALSRMAVLNLNAGGMDAVEKRAQEIKGECQDMLQKLHIPESLFTKSKTWALWDMARAENFLYRVHTDPKAAEKNNRHVGDPMTDFQQRREIVNRRVGREAYLAYTKGNKEFVEYVESLDEKRRNALKKIISQAKRANNRLSPYRLELLGRRLRESLATTSSVARKSRRRVKAGEST